MTVGKCNTTSTHCKTSSFVFITVLILHNKTETIQILLRTGRSPIPIKKYSKVSNSNITPAFALCRMQAEGLSLAGAPSTSPFRSQMHFTWSSFSQCCALLSSRERGSTGQLTITQASLVHWEHPFQQSVLALTCSDETQRVFPFPRLCTWGELWSIRSWTLWNCWHNSHIVKESTVSCTPDAQLFEHFTLVQQLLQTVQWKAWGWRTMKSRATNAKLSLRIGDRGGGGGRGHVLANLQHSTFKLPLRNPTFNSLLNLHYCFSPCFGLQYFSTDTRTIN